jgi:hypothetical protein
VITLRRFRLLEAALRERGYGPMIEWSETIEPPPDADAFAERAICNSGMANAVARLIYARCMEALQSGRDAVEVFGHPGKAVAIDTIWRERQTLFEAYRGATDQLVQLRTLPWIGEITAFHLAKNLGADLAKPDVHLERLARRDKTTTARLCARLARETGYRAATIDSILWRACADRLLNSWLYERDGWKAAFYSGARASD